MDFHGFDMKTHYKDSPLSLILSNSRSMINIFVLFTWFSYRQNQIYQYSLDCALVRKWKVSQRIMGINLDNSYVYITTKTQLQIYDLENRQDNIPRRSWNFPKNANHSSRKLQIYKKEIFIVDNSRNCVFVYSKFGELLRKWGKHGKLCGEFRYPWDIAISKNIIYVTESDNHRIQAFDLHGQYLFQCYPRNRLDSDLRNICILDDELYVSDWKRKMILKFALI